jgi:CBS domain-containing protein
MVLREVLHAHIPVLTPESTVRDAVDKMDIYQFPALVVVDANAHPVAVVTEGDLARAVMQRGNLTSLGDEPAHIHGTREPTVANADTEVSDALHLMLMSGLSILPIIDESRLCGVVMRCDLMQAMLMDALALPSE